MLKILSAAAAVGMLLALGAASPVAAAPAEKGIQQTAEDLSSRHVRGHRVYPRRYYRHSGYYRPYRYDRPYYARPYYYPGPGIYAGFGPFGFGGWGWGGRW